MLYKTDAYYDGAADAGIAWDDPDLAIDWAIDMPLLSDKDRAAPRLAAIAPPFPPGAW